MTFTWHHSDAISISFWPFHHDVHLHIGRYTCFLFLKMISLHHMRCFIAIEYFEYFLLNQTWTKIADIFIVSQIFSWFTSFVFLFDITEPNMNQFTVFTRPRFNITYIYSFLGMSGRHHYMDKDITQGHSCGILSACHHGLAPIGTKSSAIPILTSQWPRCGLIRCSPFETLPSEYSGNIPGCPSGK